MANWISSEQEMVLSLSFQDFSAAFGFILRVALLAEQQNHHPEIYNVYNQVTLRLRTHDAGDIVTEKDVRLAQAIDKLLS